MKRVYLDYASTTPVDPLVLQAMTPYFFEHFGNPSSPHFFGQDARKAIEDARENVARNISAMSQEIIFTSGTTESNNMAIYGVARALKDKGNHIIASRIEHHSVSRPIEELKAMGFDVTWINVDQFGRVDLEEIRKAITDKTILICVMHASNEVGTIEPINDVGLIARERNVYFLVDAAQTVGHIPVNINDFNCDFLSFSAHKFYGPKGVGGLFVRKGAKISSFLLGGDQERSQRASTHNVAGIVGLSQAFMLSVQNMTQERESQRQLRDQLIEFVKNNIDGVVINGHPIERLANNAHFSFEEVNSEELLMSLDMNGFCASMGSACTSGSLMPSHVLTGMGLSEKAALGSLRVSLGRWTTHEEIMAFGQQLKKSIDQLRR